MKLSDVAGVFSRYFVVGFFVPAFFALAAASLLATPDLLPKPYAKYTAGTQLVVLGGLAIAVGMLLQGFQPALLSGLVQHRSGADWYRFIPAWLYRLMLKPQQATFRRMEKLKNADNPPVSPRLYGLLAKVARRRSNPRNEPDAALAEATDRTRTTAGSRLEERFPQRLEDVVPTQLGNTLLATQEYAHSRWGLDTWPVWSRLEGLLSDQERQALSDSKSEVAFFVNSAVAALGVGAVVIVDAIWHAPLPARAAPLYALPFLLAYAFYRLSVGAAARWGQYTRAAVDLHRPELFERMGFRLPRTYPEQYRLARALNRFMLYTPRDVSRAVSPSDSLITFVQASGGRGPVPRHDADADRFRQVNWVPASPADNIWLENDCVLHGVGYATDGGQRIDPRNVTVDASGVARVHHRAGFALPDP
jgi:hypothetical protein